MKQDANSEGLAESLNYSSGVSRLFVSSLLFQIIFNCVKASENTILSRRVNYQPRRSRELETETVERRMFAALSALQQFLTNKMERENHNVTIGRNEISFLRLTGTRSQAILTSFSLKFTFHPSNKRVLALCEMSIVRRVSVPWCYPSSERTHVRGAPWLTRPHTHVIHICVSRKCVLCTNTHRLSWIMHEQQRMF